MKKIKIFFFVLCVGLLSACSIGGQEFPEGVWKSEYPSIILYLTGSAYLYPTQWILGVYAYDGEEAKVYVMLDTPRSSKIRIEPITSVQNGISSEVYFQGFFTATEDAVYLTVHTGQHADRYSEIVFHRLEDYEQINPDDWFP